VWIVALLAVSSGALLLAGLMTPIAGAVAGLTGIVAGVGSMPLDVARAALVASAAGAIVLLGPGAFSIDARLFGRREIIIPHDPRPTARGGIPRSG
jgi:uncharacterized membrane protein YphA (DoxX/SURF4 family)